MFLDNDEMNTFKARARRFFKEKPDLLAKLRKSKNTLLWTSKEIALFDRYVFEGSSAASYS